MRTGSADADYVHEEEWLRRVKLPVPEGRQEAVRVRIGPERRQETEGHPQLPPAEAVEGNEEKKMTMTIRERSWSGGGATRLVFFRADQTSRLAPLAHSGSNGGEGDARGCTIITL